MTGAPCRREEAPESLSSTRGREREREVKEAVARKKRQKGWGKTFKFYDDSRGKTPKRNIETKNSLSRSYPAAALITPR